MATTIYPRVSNHPLEPNYVQMHPLVSWRSVVAGLLVACIAMAALIALGMAFGGNNLDMSTSAQRIGTFTGIWFLISTLLALFAGGYFAARISKFQTARVGSAQGLVIAALFFGFVMWQSMAALGWVGRATGSAVSATATAGMQSPVVTEIVEDAMADLNLKADPSTVVSGIASRLLRGNTESAKAYLARQAGITKEEADRRIAQLRTQSDQALAQAKEAASKALSATGWTLFLTLLLGSIASVFGGALGSRANYRKPLTRDSLTSASDFTSTAV